MGYSKYKILNYNTSRKPTFKTKSFQLHDICNYLSTGFLNLKKYNYGNFQLS